jgi:hypothetical protein
MTSGTGMIRLVIVLDKPNVEMKVSGNAHMLNL